MFHETIERDNTDVFISWGWMDKSKKIIPAPNILASILVRQKKYSTNLSNNLILWIGTEPTTQHLMFLESFPTTTTMIPYLKWQERFLLCLNTNVLSQLIFRPYPTKKWHHHLNSLNNKLKIDDQNNKENFFERLKNTKVMISDHIGTSFLFALALNIPTILFWEKKTWPLREDAKPYFELLKTAKIYHETPESAALHLNGIVNNLDKWWQNEMVQDTRRKFCKNYILTSDSFINDWVKILTQLQKN